MDAEPAPAARCAVLARALDEPLAGTAPVARRWLCVEDGGAWPRTVHAHRDPAVRLLAARATDAGWRLLLIRRPGRRTRTPGPVTVLLAETDPAGPRVSRLTVHRDRLGLLRLPGPDEPLPGVAVDEPLLLVCTHGRRDLCCALDGRALVGAVVAGTPEMAPHVWESSHLGGHRFAPTALVLPTGYLYGRLDPATAVDVLKAAAHEEMEPLLCRGRSTWTPAGQVAELAVRRATGLREAAAVWVGGWPDDDVAAVGAAELFGGAGRVAVGPAGRAASGSACDTARAAFSGPPPGQAQAAGSGVSRVLVAAADGRRWLVEVIHEAPDRARPASCGADPTPVPRLRLGTVRPLPGVAP